MALIPRRACRWLRQPVHILGFLIGITVWPIIYPWAVRTLVPTSLWLDVREVQVLSSEDGTSPRVIIDRDVNRDVTLDVITFLRPVDAPVSRCRREIDGVQLKVGDIYPSGIPIDDVGQAGTLSLADLQDVPPNVPCQMRNGDYVVDFVWRWRSIWFPGVTFEETATSNIFVMSGLPEGQLVRPYPADKN